MGRGEGTHMSLVNGDCDIANGCEDPLADINDVAATFSHLVGGAQAKEHRKNQIQEKIWTLHELKEQGVVPVDMSPVPVHNGIGNTTTRCSQN